jgi:hypothetical protein
VRPIASSSASAPIFGGNGRLSDARIEDWPLDSPTARKASSQRRPVARAAR